MTNRYIKLTQFIFFLSCLSAQDLCSPSQLETVFYDQRVDLSWNQGSNYGEALFSQCFLTCEGASTAMEVVHDEASVSGGWFRVSDGSSTNCGSGMYPCEPGGDDNFSAYAGYAAQSEPVESRLIGTVDLSAYSNATVEFIETYSYGEDASASNHLELSNDGGVTWTSVYESIPGTVADEYWFNAIDISAYTGDVVQFSFRYSCTAGYGESWYVDQIVVSGTNSGAGDLCTVPASYKIYMDGVEIGTSQETEYSVTGLTNGTEYCFEVSALLADGSESEPSAIACEVPVGDFNVSPTTVSFDRLSAGDYSEQILGIENFGEGDASFEITSLELANVQAAMDIFSVNFNEGSLGSFTDESGLWVVGDPDLSSSQYFPLEIPEGAGMVAYIDDDAAGYDGSASAMLVSDEILSMGGHSILLFDLFFASPSGLCGGTSTYSDDFTVHVSIDNGQSWQLAEDGIRTGGWNWASYMYNLDPHVGDAASFRIGLQYTDCGGNWAYGVALDNVHVKAGDDFTWLTVSPYKGTVKYYNHTMDSIGVEIGVFGVYDNFTVQDNLLVESGEASFTVQVGVGVALSMDESDFTPVQYALHQNYPNPFNPETNIQFDIAENSVVKVSVYDLVGKKVATLLNKNLGIGSYNIKWRGLDDKGSSLPSGMYFYEMKTENFRSMKKLILVK